MAYRIHYHYNYKTADNPAFVRQVRACKKSDLNLSIDEIANILDTSPYNIKIILMRKELRNEKL